MRGPRTLKSNSGGPCVTLKRPTFATLVTARCSGSTYLNQVELQNGCLALAHSNLFIPSNLNGSCFDPDSGTIDQQRLMANMDTATDVYISRCNGAPCGESVIHLVKGADSSRNQELRASALVFLKGTKVSNDRLKKDKPDDYELIQQVWEIRNQHMVKNVPCQYMFYLKCCRQEDCCHPLCSSQHKPPSVWFPGGPEISYLPFPVPDPSFPWGNSNCSKCEGQCYGHFLDPKKAVASPLPPMIRPPSILLKEEFDKLHSEASEECIHEVAKKCLLPPLEVRIWFDHLEQIQKNRKRGAEKAAETRRRKKEAAKQVAEAEVMQAAKQAATEQSNEETFCGICQQMYAELTEENEHWIQCDICPKWYRFECVGIHTTSLPKNYNFVCKDCSNM